MILTPCGVLGCLSAIYKMNISQTHKHVNKTLVFTGGHHTGALEVAKMLKDKGWNIAWFGHRHSAWGDRSDSAEYKEVTADGIKFYNFLW